MIEIEADHRVLLLRIDNEIAASAGNLVGIASSRGRFLRHGLNVGPVRYGPVTCRGAVVEEHVYADI